MWPRRLLDLNWWGAPKPPAFYSNFAVPGSPAEPEFIRYMIVIYAVLHRGNAVYHRIYWHQSRCVRFSIGITMVWVRNELWIHTVIDRNRRPVPYSSVPIPHCNEWQRMSTVCIPCIPCIFRVYTGYRPYWRCRDNSEKLLNRFNNFSEFFSASPNVHEYIALENRGKPREIHLSSVQTD